MFLLCSFVERDGKLALQGKATNQIINMPTLEYNLIILLTATTFIGFMLVAVVVSD